MRKKTQPAASRTYSIKTQSVTLLTSGLILLIALLLFSNLYGAFDSNKKIAASNERTLTYISEGEAWGSLPYDLRALGLYYTSRKAEALPFARKAAELSPSPRLLENVRLIENEVGESTNTQP